jgi:drug/metabolite transporter (DMT)-like permease
VSSKQNILPVAGVLSGALVWGLVWYPYRVLQSNGISGAMSTMITYLLAMLVGGFLFRKVWSERSEFGKWELLLILTSGWSNFGYVVAMLHGEVMRVLLLFYIAPVWTIIFSFWLLGERLNRYGYFVVALSLSGAAIMLWRPGFGLPLPQNLSEWLGLSAGFSFALANVISRRTVNLSVEAKSLSVWLGAAILTVPFIFWQDGVLDQLFAINKQSWLILGVMGLALWGTSYAVQYGVTHLAANRAAVLFLFELVVAAVSSYFLAGEEMGWREWIGAIPIILASFLSGKLYLDKCMS